MTHPRQAAIEVEHVEDGRRGPSGHPMAKGWWFSLTINGHRQRGFRKTEVAAWNAAAAELTGPWAKSLLGLEVDRGAA